MWNLLIMVGELLLAAWFHKENAHFGAMLMCFFAGGRFVRMLKEDLNP